MFEDLIPLRHFEPFWSSILIYGFATGGYVSLAAHALTVRYRKLQEARAADATVDVNSRLAPGRAIVTGVVEYAQGAQQAIRITIDQDGTESQNKGGWYHRWTETNRRIHAEPFYVRIDADKRIRVEPTEKIFFVDALAGFNRIDLTKRFKFAELTPGETVFASGTLVRANDPEAPVGTGGYRSGNDSLVLRPSADETMLLSAEPLGDRYRARAKFYGDFAFGILVIALLCNVYFWGFHVRRFMGETMPIPISKLDSYATQGDEGQNIYHYRVQATLPSGDFVLDHVNLTTYQQLHVGDLVPFRAVSGTLRDWSTIGPHVTAPFSAATLVPLFALMCFLYWFEARKTRPWYERKVVDQGEGRLESTLVIEQGRAFVPPK